MINFGEQSIEDVANACRVLSGGGDLADAVKAELSRLADREERALRLSVLCPISEIQALALYDALGPTLFQDASNLVAMGMSANQIALDLTEAEMTGIIAAEAMQRIQSDFQRLSAALPTAEHFSERIQAALNPKNKFTRTDCRFYCSNSNLHCAVNPVDGCEGCQNFEELMNHKIQVNTNPGSRIHVLVDGQNLRGIQEINMTPEALEVTGLCFASENQLFMADDRPVRYTLSFGVFSESVESDAIIAGLESLKFSWGDEDTTIPSTKVAQLGLSPESFGLSSLDFD